MSSILWVCKYCDKNFGSDQSVHNHIFKISMKTISSIIEDPELLKEKLLSIPGHISNEHEFPENSKYMGCPHPPLTGERAKAWLPPGCLAVKKVQNALAGSDGSRLRDVPYMVGFTHTGPIGKEYCGIFIYSHF